MKVIGIETSCDETGVAVYDSDKGLVADLLFSQIKLHQRYGGVVPEIASRDHIRKTLPMIHEALKKSQLHRNGYQWDCVHCRTRTDWSAAGWRESSKISCPRLGGSRAGNPSYGRSLTGRKYGR